MRKIGLIAGNRNFPLKFCEAAKRKGCYVVAVAIKGDTSAQINKLADKTYWLSLADYSRLFEVFRNEGVKEVVMAGQISPRRLFSREIYKDSGLKQLLEEVKDKKADTLFSAIADKMLHHGFTLLDSTLFMEDFLPGKGVLTKREPSFSEWEDIYFGFALAKEIGLLDIGQTVAVKNKAVVAVEALEGTDNLIRRAGRITRCGAVVVKASKPDQDRRFDMPLAGLNTVKNLVGIKAAGFAVEAGKTVFLDRERSIALADRHKLAIVAL